MRLCRAANPRSRSENSSLTPKRCQISLFTALLFTAVACWDGGLGATVPLPAPVDSEGLAAAAAGGDARDGGSEATARKPSSAVVFRFGMRGIPGEDFLASTSDPLVMEKARAELAQSEESRRLHINGQIDRARGKSNLDWRWTHVESSWDLVEVSIEVCDGRPSFVESDLRTWLALGQFCPAASYVKSEVATPAR